MNRLTCDEILQLNVGDKFIEDEPLCAEVAHGVVMTKPVEKDGKITWLAQVDDGRDVEYLTTRGLHHYGPHIYKV